MKSIKSLTATECNARIRELQTEMVSADENRKDYLRGKIALLAQQAAFLNRNVFKVNHD